MAISDRFPCPSPSWSSGGGTNGSAPAHGFPGSHPHLVGVSTLTSLSEMISGTEDKTLNIYF